jgi:hypothetical protein
MAIRVGTLSHNAGGIRVSSNTHTFWSVDFLVVGVSPAVVQPGTTVTVTVSADQADSVTGVLFRSTSVAFQQISANQITFVAPDAHLYGSATIQVQTASTSVNTSVTHQPVTGNQYVTIAAYPPGLNEHGDHPKHLGEGFDPQPANNQQLEVRGVDPAWGFELYPDTTYSINSAETFERRVIYTDGTASGWFEVTVQEVSLLQTVGAPSVVRVTASSAASSENHTTTGAPSAARVTASAGSSLTGHMTAGSASVSRNTATPGTSAVGDQHVTQADNSQLVATVSSGTSTSAHSTTGVPSVLVSQASAGASVAHHTTTGAPSVLASRASAGVSASEGEHYTVGAPMVLACLVTAGTSVLGHLVPQNTIGAPSTMRVTLRQQLGRPWLPHNTVISVRSTDTVSSPR